MAKKTERIYLDYNATTPLEDDVIQTITTTLKHAWGNPSSSYEAGVHARDVVATAREQIAYAINAKPSDIVFTSGGTEANNWVIQTAINSFNNKKAKGEISGVPHIVTSSVEHDSISLPLKALVDKGEIDATFVPICESLGYVTSRDIVSAVRSNTCLITIMMANNETGTIMPLQEICQEINKIGGSNRPLLHTDAAQTLGKIPVDVEDLAVDYLTIVGHKFYGPRIGALYVRGLDKKRTPLYPLFYGGGQERNYRPGTENTPMIAGLGKAAMVSKQRLKEFCKNMSDTRNYLEKELLEHLGEGVVKFNCSTAPRLPNTSSISFMARHAEGYKLMQRIQGFCCSTGSACHSDTCQPSKVLLSFHIPFEQATNTLRISTGRSTSFGDIDQVVEELKSIIDNIQATE